MAKSRTTGDIYYVNSVTGVTTFDYPTEAADPAAAAAAAAADAAEPLDNRELPSGWDEVTNSGAHGPNPHRRIADRPVLPYVLRAAATTAEWRGCLCVAAGSKFYVDVISGKTQTEFPSVPSLADGWEIATGSTGKVYYVHAASGQISNTPPPAPADGGGEALDSSRDASMQDEEDSMLLQHAAAIRIQSLHRGAAARKVRARRARASAVRRPPAHCCGW